MRYVVPLVPLLSQLPPFHPCLPDERTYDSILFRSLPVFMCVKMMCLSLLTALTFTFVFLSHLDGLLLLSHTFLSRVCLCCPDVDVDNTMINTLTGWPSDRSTYIALLGVLLSLFFSFSRMYGNKCLAFLRLGWNETFNYLQR